MGKTVITRLALLRTAEKLFAERGVDAVSLREVAASAGERSQSAVLYHFRDKRALLEALLERHARPLDEAFVPALSKLRAEKKESLESLVALLVRPMVDLLGDEDGGIEYITICDELVHSRTFPITGLRATNGPGSETFRQRLFTFMRNAPPLLVPVRMMQMTSLLFGSLATYHRLSSAGLFIPRELFCDDLIGTLSALLSSRS